MISFPSLTWEDVGEWPLLPQLLLLFVVALVLQGGGYLYFLSPMWGQLQALRQQEQTLKSMIKVKARSVAGLPEVERQRTQLMSRYQASLRQFPSQQELAGMLATINQLGVAHSLAFTRIDWGVKQSHPLMYQLPLNIELTGDYHDIGEFSEAIARLPRIIILDQVEWQRVSHDSREVSWRVRAYSYQFKAESNHDSEKP